MTNLQGRYDKLAKKLKNLQEQKRLRGADIIMESLSEEQQEHLGNHDVY